ncbi:unnamed protein product [Phyllotreta striolata]|uniref:Uncharacterized protein n=1 Tax=Phyllotreta striolata TaxID=444603 RepID=A0A9N9TNH8_PHYSR|nr:unnamed protein product [Phyllotreta striolata]
MSQPNTEEVGSKQRGTTGKRKKLDMDSSTEEGETRKKDRTEDQQLVKSIHKVLKAVKKVKDLIDKTNNTRGDIRNATRELGHQAEKLSFDLEGWDIPRLKETKEFCTQTEEEDIPGVKEKINIDNMNINIKGVRKIGEGDLQITIQEGNEKARILEKELKQNCNATEITTRSSGKTLYLLGIDPTVGEEEIKVNLWKTLNIDKDSIDVRAIRKSRLENNMAIVVMPGSVLENG